jgi:hypothetical protein
MDILSMIVIVMGLCLFEIISSIDNAVVNAEVLHTMSKKGRQWFLLWGLLFAVFVVRGLLPWLIIWATIPSLGPLGALTATFSNDPTIGVAIESSKPILLMGGGTFLIFLFFHWLFMEPKNYGLKGERFFHEQGAWFYAVVSVALSLIVWFAMNISPMVAFGGVIGSTAFFITNGFKQNAEDAEKDLMHEGKGSRSDLSKILYLEAIDMTFSIDGVLGAFAFTLSVPLIIIGNGIGALVLRKLTVGNMDRIKKYPYLKNGAMYSILCLGAVMIADGFGVETPFWLSPVITFIVIGFFLRKSIKEISV